MRVHQGSEATLPDTQFHKKMMLLDSILLTLIAFILHSYRLAQNPIWLDEALIFLFSQQGLDKLFFLGFIGPHPPLYYLVQWLSSGMGSWQTEWGWRWLPLFCGTLNVPLLYILMRRMVSRPNAIITVLLFTLAPMHLYFSQESRPYAFLMLWATISIFQLHRVQTNPQRILEWGALTLVSLVGLFSGYSYVFIIMGQYLYLTVIRGYWLRSIISGFLVVLPAGFALLSYITPTVSYTLGQYADRPALTFVQMAASLLAIDHQRYGIYWGHQWQPILFGCLILVALWQTVEMYIVNKRDDLSMNAAYATMPLYYLCQVILPPLIFFTIVTPFLGIKLPVKDAKQFIILFPALFILVAIAFNQLKDIRPKGLGTVFIVLICGSIMAADIAGIVRYWQTTKSPEGLAVRQLQTALQADDGLMILHYSPASVFTFYMPDRPYYVLAPSTSAPSASSPSASGDASTDYQFYQNHEQPESARPLDEILTAHPIMWLLHYQALPAPMQDVLEASCTFKSSSVYGPFTLQQFDCE
ncbi:MAG: glycosyltransferase family 39 protein [Chloroflexota bacterium]